MAFLVASIASIAMCAVIFMLVIIGAVGKVGMSVAKKAHRQRIGIFVSPTSTP